MRLGKIEVLRNFLSCVAPCCSRQRWRGISKLAFVQSIVGSIDWRGQVIGTSATEEEKDAGDEGQDGDEDAELSEVQVSDANEAVEDEIDGKGEHAAVFGEGHGGGDGVIGVEGTVEVVDVGDEGA
jgi:hypothetical protein